MQVVSASYLHSDDFHIDYFLRHVFFFSFSPIESATTHVFAELFEQMIYLGANVNTLIVKYQNDQAGLL